MMRMKKKRRDICPPMGQYIHSGVVSALEKPGSRSYRWGNRVQSAISLRVMAKCREHASKSKPKLLLKGDYQEPSLELTSTVWTLLMVGVAI
jgi:hypothetical protein